MLREYTFTPRFTLIVNHLKALRTLREYVNGVGLEKDMQGFFNYLQQDLSRSVFRPAGWEDLYVESNTLYSSPKSPNPKSSSPKSTWRVVKDDFIAIEVYPAGPLDDDYEPFVNLYVPLKWKKRSQFIAKLKAPSGFQHVSQFSDGEQDERNTITRYIPYTSYIGAEGLFDTTGFIGAFGEATKALVAMEKDIDGILGHLA